MGPYGARGQQQGPGGGTGHGGYRGEPRAQGGWGLPPQQGLPHPPAMLTVSLPVLCRTRSMVQIVISR